MNGNAARDRLVEHGQRLFDARKKPVRFTGEPPGPPAGGSSFALRASADECNPGGVA